MFAMTADEDNAEDVSAPLDKVLDCVTSCIHVAHLQETIRQGKSLIHVFLCALSPGFSWTGTLTA